MGPTAGHPSHRRAHNHDNVVGNIIVTTITRRKPSSGENNKTIAGGSSSSSAAAVSVYHRLNTSSLDDVELTTAQASFFLSAVMVARRISNHTASWTTTDGI